jgi:hypothetical protein
MLPETSTKPTMHFEKISEEGCLPRIEEEGWPPSSHIASRTGGWGGC